MISGIRYIPNIGKISNATEPKSEKNNKRDVNNNSKAYFRESVLFSSSKNLP